MRWWGWLALLLVFLLVLVSVATSTFFQPWLKKKLITTVAEKSQGLYALQISHLEASLWSGRLALEDFSLTPDTARLAELQKSNQPQAPAMYAQIKAHRLQISGLNYLHLLRGTAPALQKVRLDDARVEVNQVRKDTSTLPLYARLPQPVQGLSIDQIHLRHVDFLYKKHGQKASLAEIKKATLQVQNVKLDSGSARAKDRFFYAQEMRFQAQSLNVLLPQALYRLKKGPVSASTKDQSLSFQKVQLVPLYTPAQLARKLGHQTSHFKIYIPQVQFTGADFLAYSRNTELLVEKVLIRGARLDIYKDSKHFPSAPQPLPHDLLRKVPLPLTFQTVENRGTFIRYEELTSKAEETGVVTVSDLNATGTNLSNVPKRMSAKTPAVVKGNFKIMGKAFMQVSIRYNLLDPAGRHFIQGSVKKSYPAILNPILEPSMAVRVKSGTLHHGAFSMQLSDASASGTMRLQYEDFKVDLLSKSKLKEEDQQSFGKKVLSKLVNKVVINTHNMPQNGKFRVGKIEVTRDPEKSIIRYWIDGLSSGIRSTLGIKEKKMKE